MRIGIQGWGSEGDLRPLVALAAGLRRSGHSVRMDLTAIDGTDYTELGRRLEVPIRMIPERLDYSLHEAARDADSVDPLKLSRELVDRCFFPYLDRLYEAALELCATSDLVVWHYSSWYTKAAALKTGVPHAAVHFFPGLVPTRTAAPAGLPDLGPLNPLLWSIARAVLDLQFRKRPALFFAGHGLPGPRRVLPDLLFSEHLNLHAFSPRLCPPAPDWSDQHRVVGQLTLGPGGEGWVPSKQLAEFLAAGPKPVLYSLGSMEHFAPRRARELLIAAARATRMRAILQTKRSDEEGRDGALFFLPWAPHEALLPSCSLMVHHGGAGTTHSALRAGVPAVVVPFIFEQQVWATRLLKTGCTVRAVPFWKATPDRLAGAVQAVASSGHIQASASALGAELALEDGVGDATALLERIPSVQAGH